MILMISYLRQTHKVCHSLKRFYSNSKLRTIDVHAIHQEPKVAQPFRTSNNDPVRLKISSHSFNIARCLVCLAFT